jgi:hypothetical protein
MNSLPRSGADDNSKLFPAPGVGSHSHCGHDQSPDVDKPDDAAYHVQESLSLTAPNWYDSVLGLISPDGASTTRNVADTNAAVRFYRVQAVFPPGP